MMRRKSASVGSRLGNRRGARGSGGSMPLQKLLVLIVGAVAASCLTLAWFFFRGGEPRVRGRLRAESQHLLPIPSVDNSHNAIAMDIIKSLACESLGGEAGGEAAQGLEAVAQRRLEGVSGEGDAGNEEWQPGVDDLVDPLYATSARVTAKELMCLVAGTSNLPSHVTAAAFKCDALGSKREALLDVWASARSQMSLDMIKTTLDWATESERTLAKNTLNIWAPWNDETVEYLVATLNEETSGVWDLRSVLGPGRLFIDIGSGLGLSSLAVALLYPGSTVLPVEPAAPSWLLSRLNIVCNLPTGSKLPTPVLAGVGQKNDGMGKFMWRPWSTGTTRSWTRKSEHRDDDVEIVVRLRTFRSILAEATAEEDLEADPPRSVVVNVDCEGCEYNLVPSLSDSEFNAIDAIIGTTGVHFGYIPEDKRPSSTRVEAAHKRLCQHYDFARQSIECCAFPDLKVKRPGKSDVELTVSKASDNLCDTFNTWASENKLYESTDDFGWTELSSMSGI